VFSSGPAQTSGNGTDILLTLALAGAGAVAVAAALHQPATGPSRQPRPHTPPHDSDTTGIPSHAAAGPSGDLADGFLPDALHRLRTHLDTPAASGHGAPTASHHSADTPRDHHDGVGAPAPGHRIPTRSTEDTVPLAAWPTAQTSTVVGSRLGAIRHVEDTPAGAGPHDDEAGSPDHAAGRDSDAPEPPGLGPDAVPALLGVNADATVGVDLAALHGLGLTGPAATSATRALLLGLLARTAGQPPVRVVIETGHARELLAVPDTTLAEVPQLVCVTDLDHGLDLVEFEILRRARINTQGPPEPRFPPMVLFAQPTEGQRARLTAILAMGAHLRVAAVIHGPWPTGTQLDLAVDATVSSATGIPALLHTRMFITTADHARDYLIGGSPSTAPTTTAGTGEPAAGDPAGEPPTAPVPDATDNSALDTTGGHHATPAAEPSDPTGPEEPLEQAPGEAATVAPPSVLPVGPGLDEPTIPDTALLAISCFGTFRVRARTEPGGLWSDITARTPPKHRLLLGYLIAHDGATPDELLEAGWPDTTYKQAQQRLQSTMTALRRTWRQATGLADEQFITLHRDLLPADPRAGVDRRTRAAQQHPPRPRRAHPHRNTAPPRPRRSPLHRPVPGRHRHRLGRHHPPHHPPRRHPHVDQPGPPPARRASRPSPGAARARVRTPPRR
jgi:hypothetical protein